MSTSFLRANSKLPSAQRQVHGTHSSLRNWKSQSRWTSSPAPPRGRLELCISPSSESFNISCYLCARVPFWHGASDGSWNRATRGQPARPGRVLRNKRAWQRRTQTSSPPCCHLLRRVTTQKTPPQHQNQKGKRGSDFSLSTRASHFLLTLLCPQLQVLPCSGSCGTISPPLLMHRQASKLCCFIPP